MPIAPIGFNAGKNTRKSSLLLDDNELQTCQGFKYEHDGKLVCRNTRTTVNEGPVGSIHNIDRYINTVICGDEDNVRHKWELTNFCKYYNKNKLSWYIGNPIEDNEWNSICWSPELEIFVAVALPSVSATNLVMTSSDGITWILREETERSQWNEVCWSPELSLFCAVAGNGTNRVMTSADGITWTAREAAKANKWKSVCWSPELNLFCAVSGGNNETDTIMTSPDGTTWTSRTPPEESQWQSICWSSELGLFCAVGQTGTYRIITSSDGITWTGRTVPISDDWYTVCWSPELKKFCAVANGTGVVTSSDGVTWEEGTAAADSDWMSIVWCADLMQFIAISDTGTYRAMVSIDGIKWIVSDIPGSDTKWQSVCYSPKLKRLVAVGLDAEEVMIADIDEPWMTRVSAEDNSWSSVCWSPTLKLYCAVAYSGTNRVMVSSDGITWTAKAAAEANSWYSVCWSPELSLFCAVAASGTNRVMTSPDGTTWTARAAAEANSWYSICWSPELSLFCAVAANGTNRVMTSPDGITWTAREAAEADTWITICWSSELELFVAVAYSGTSQVMTSPDGTTWTAREAAEANSWRSICWSSELELFVAVAYSGTNRVMTSTDGITWTARTVAIDTWYAVTWSAELELFIAVSGIGNILRSSDGITWYLQVGPEGNAWLGICYAPELRLFCAVSNTGSNNRVMTNYNKHDFEKIDTIASSKRWSITKYAKWFFIVNGHDTKAMSLGNLYDWGALNPSSAPIGAAGDAGNPSGTYYLYYTFYIKFPNGEVYETGPSPQGSVTVTDQAISWDGIRPCYYSGTGLTIWRKLYRSVSSVVYYVATIKDNTTTTYTDDDTDATVQANDSITTTSYDVPPDGMTQLDNYLERVWGIAENTLYPSEAYLPFNFNPLRSIAVVPEGETLRAIKKWGDQLYVASPNKWYRLQGNDPDTWGIKRTFTDAGVINGDTVHVTKFGILGLWYDGIYVFDGSVSRNITEKKIGVELFNNTISDLDACYAAWDGRIYYFYYPVTGENISNCLAIDFSNYPELRFYNDDFKATVHNFHEETGKRYLGKDDGFQYEEVDGDETIETEVRTGSKHGGNVFQLKNLKEIWYDINTNGKTVTVSFYIDGSLQSITKTINNSSRERKRIENLPQNWEGYWFDVKLTCSDSDGIEIYSPWGIEINPAGRA